MKKSVVLKYGIAVLVGGSMTAVYLLSRNFPAGAETAERYRMLCDAFTIPGSVLMLSAALVALANAGSFTGIGYSFQNVFAHLIPGLGLRQEKYGEYYERHQKKKVTGYGFLLHVGGAFMAVALVFFILFYVSYKA